MKGLKITRWIAAGLAIVAALALVLGVAVMLLWNWLMPEIFSLTTISYWQAVGLVLLSHLLFKGPPLGHRRRPRPVGPGSERWEGFADHVRQHLRDEGPTPDG